MPVVAAPAGMAGYPPYVPTQFLASRQVRVGNFVQIARMSLALLFGLAGGLVACFLAGRGRADRGP